MGEVKTEAKKQENAKKEELETVEKVEEVVKFEPTSERKKGIWITLVIIAIIIVLVAVFSTIFAIINSQNVKILKGITVNQIDISNLTKEEAITKLEEIYETKSDKQIYLSHEDYETSITYEALEVNYKIQEAVDKAYEFGRNGNIIQNNFSILDIWRNGRNIELDVTIDSDMIKQIAQNINNSIDDAVVQPSYYIEKSKLIITAGKQGVKVDEEQLLSKIYDSLYKNTEDEIKIEIPMVQDNPDKINIEEIHKEIYKEVKDAYYTKEPFTVYPEEEGIDFDVEQANAILS